MEADDLSPLAAALCAIGELEQHDMIEDDEALTYRTMAVEGNIGLLAAMEVYAVDQDIEELADTLQRVVAIANATGSRSRIPSASQPGLVVRGTAVE